MMNHTEKKVLIPYDKYMRLIKSPGDQSGAENIKTHSPVGPEKVTSETKDHIHQHNDDESDNKQITFRDDNILDTIPQKIKPMAKILLNYIHHQKLLTWNEKGELVIDGQPIPFSHITDLIKDALVEYKHFIPVGIREFYSKLSNIPLTLIKNSKRRALLQEGRGGDMTGIPPGIPDKKESIGLDALSADKPSVKKSPKGPSVKRLTNNAKQFSWLKHWKQLK